MFVRDVSKTMLLKLGKDKVDKEAPVQTVNIISPGFLQRYALLILIPSVM